MDRIAFYLESIPIWMIVAVPLAAVVLVLGIPGRLRLGVGLALMVVWLTLSQMSDLAAIQALTKASIPAVYLYIILTAMVAPGARRNVSLPAWLLFAVACFTPLYVFTTADNQVALLIRLNWILLVLATIVTTRTITDDASLRYVIGWLFVGIVVATAIASSALVFDPGAAFRAGINRFRPYDAQSNEIGTLFVLATAFGLYYGLTGPGLFRRIVGFGTAGVGFGLAAMTVSRSVVFPALLAAMPTLFKMVRHPIIVILGVLVVAGVIQFLIQVGSDAEVDLERLGSLESGRYQLFQEYVTELSNRPAFNQVFGLMLTRDQSFRVSEEADMHAHNAYLELAYMGGLSYVLPMLALEAYGLYCAFYVWYRRRTLDNDPLLITLLASLLGITLLHGMTTGTIYSHSNPWAFWHIFLLVFFMTAAHHLKRLPSHPATVHAQPAG